MSFKSIVRELKEMKDGIGNISRRGIEGKHWRRRARSYIAPDQGPLSGSLEQGQWANLPPELLLDIIQRVEQSETSWPARNVLVFCASVCRSWRDITKEIVKTPEECGRLTFPISLKQVILSIYLSLLFLCFYGFQFPYTFYQCLILLFILSYSRGRVILQYSALLEGIERQPHFFCTLA